MVLKRYLKEYNDGGSHNEDDRRKEIFDFFISKGYTPEQAAGIMGNFMQESRLSTTVVNESEGSVGLAQWNPSAKAGNRLGALKDFAKKNDMQWSDLRTQLEFVNYELDTKPYLGKKDLLEASTPQEAAIIFSNKYEIPSKKYAHNDKRVNYALDIYRTYAPQGVNTEPIKKDYTEKTVTEKDNTNYNREYKVEDRSQMIEAKPQEPVTKQQLLEELKLYEKTVQQQNLVKAQSQMQESEQPQLPYVEQAQQYQQQTQRFDPYNYIDIDTYQKGGIQIPKRVGVRKNEDGTVSSHKFSYTETDGKYTVYPTLFQNEDKSWVEFSNDNWEALKEARKRGEVIIFDSEEEAKKFSAGSWKNKQTNFQKGGVYDDKDSNPEKTYQSGTSETLTNLGKNMASYFIGAKHSNLSESTYKPSKSSNKNSKYYTYEYLKNDVKKDLTGDTYINNVNTQQDNFKKQKPDYIPTYIKDKTFDSYYNYLSNSPKSSTVSGSSINLGHYKVSPGKDNKGKYISIYDKYDWNLFEELGLKGNSWEIYDRMYESDWGEIKDKEEQKGETKTANKKL